MFGFDCYNDKLIATVESDSDSDGQTVEVYEDALPAKFYTLKVLAGANSIGLPQKAYTVGTGSGMKEFALELAKQIAEGMVVFRDEE